MKKKVSIWTMIIVLISMSIASAQPVLASTTSYDMLDGYEIENLPDRIALTDEPITFSSLQYIDRDGTLDEDPLRIFKLTDAGNSKILEVVQDYEVMDVLGKEKKLINSITLTPKSVGRVTIRFSLVFDYYKTIYVYDPNMEPAERDIPQNLKIQKFTPKKLFVSWDAVYGAKKYEVYRSKTGKDGTFKRVKTTSKTTYADKGLTSGKTYYYKVKALTQDGISNASKVKKCRVSRKLKIDTAMRNRIGRSTGIIKVEITNKGVGTFSICQSVEYVGWKEFISSGSYYPYRSAGKSDAVLINGAQQAITRFNIKKGHTGVARFKLDNYRTPGNDEHIIFDAYYDGVYYTISVHRNGTVFYMYDNFGRDIKYNDDTIYQLK